MYSSAEIDRLRTKEVYCPVCQGEVIIRARPVITPHFAHQAKQDCPANRGGEGPVHEKGKLLLYQWLKKHNVDVRLEHYLPNIQQQPDLFLQLNKQRIAIEYQCSKIPITQLQKRNKGYQNAGITPIWILGPNQFEHDRSNRLHVNSFILQCMHQFNASHPFTIYFFCPNSRQFLIIQHVYLLGRGRACAVFQFKKLEELLFTQLFHPQPLERKHLSQMWTQAKRNFRLLQKKPPYGKELAWRRWLYQKKLYMAQLPSVIYLPIRNQFLMKTSPWDWQSRIWLDVIHPLSSGALFSISQCERAVCDDQIDRSQYPLVTCKESPIRQYLHLLAQFHIITQKSTDMYQKRKHIPFHSHIEEALTADEKLMKRF